LSDILKKMGVIVEISDDEMIVTLKKALFSPWGDVDIHEFLNILEGDLRKNGIIVSVDKSALISVYTQNKKEAVIARGIPYKSGRDGYL
ncbi:flagellar assembly protein A, partial [Thermoanaerobacter thermohydrosulfuricus]